MSRRTVTRIAAPIVAIAVLVAVVVVGLRLATPAQAPGPAPGSSPVLSTLPHGGCFLGICAPGGTNPTATPCSPKVTSTTVDGVHLQSWPACTAEGKAILTAYQNYLHTYLGVLKAPYGPGVSARQVLGTIYDQEAAGTYKGTSIPTDCKIPAPSTHAVSWPAACDSLLSPTNSATTAGPLKYAASQLGNVATAGGVDATLHALSGNLDAGYTTSGTITRTHDAVIRQIVSPSRTYDTNAPNPAQPLSAWVPTTAKAKATTAVVWSCLTDHLVTTSVAGQSVRHVPYMAVGMGLVRTPDGWRMNAMEVLPATTAISKGAPCGAAY